jgi:hypothetical protein
MAAGHSVDPVGWRQLFDELMFLVAGRFTRMEPRRAAREFVAGLLSPTEPKNSWWLAEHAGHVDPRRCSGCCVPPSGTLMRSAMICALS